MDDYWYGFWIGQMQPPALCITYLAPAGLPEEQWHRFRVEASISGFRADFECEERLSNLFCFAEEVAQMHRTLKGTATLDFTEGNVKIQGSVNHLGHVSWEIELRGFAESAILQFRVQEDQTMLWNVAAKIDDMLSAVAPGRYGVL